MRTRKSLTVIFHDVPEKTINELARRNKLAGLVSAAFSYYVNHSDEGRFALTAVLGGTRSSAPLKPSSVESELSGDGKTKNVVDFEERVPGDDKASVKRTVNALLFKKEKV